MSPKNSFLNAGLTALGLFALAPAGAAEPPPAPVSGPDTSVAPSPTHTVLLLTNGRLHEGMISDGGSVYLLHTKGGTIPIEKSHVETAARSVAELYQYKLSRLPERDPDEHMKLAQWCLAQRMPEEAKTQLQGVLKLSPNNRLAQSMLASILKSEDRVRLRDESVKQAGAEMTSNQPQSLDPAILRGAGRAMGISSLPQIGNLPPALAVRRADEFTHYVDPVLQARCARCHNERSEGDFRLVWYKRKSDQTVDARRANLDAVLAFVDMENPVRSEILASTLRKHGTGNNARPIFIGSNDRQYQILFKWVTSLRPGRSPVVAAQTPPATAAAADPGGRFTASDPSGNEGFASQRPAPMPTRPPASSPYNGSPFTPPGAPGTPDEVVPLPPGQFLPGSASGGQPYAPPNTEFPAPMLVGGPRPKTPAAGAPTAAPGSIPPPIPFGAQPAGAALPPPELPPGAVSAANETGVAGAPATKKKPITVDPALLGKALMNRYQPK